MLRLSNFTIFKKNNNKYWFYNTLYNSFLEIETDDHETDNILNNILNNNFQDINFDINKFKLLEDNHIFTQLTSSEEHKLFENIYYENYFFNDTAIITIAPDLKCNFRCIYCYQEQYNNSDVLNFDKENFVEKFEGFIEKYIIEKNIKKLGIVWFGGEPFLYFDAFTKLSENIKNFCIKNSIKYKFDVITNGSILNSKIIKTMNDLPINSLQITIDGIKEIHDSMRKAKSGGGTFDIIIKNLKLMLQETNTKISIRNNTGNENDQITNYKNFVNEFYNIFSEYIKTERLVIEWPVLITDTNNYKNNAKTNEYAKNFNNYLKTLIEVGHSPKQIFKLAPPYCTARTNNNLVIGPNQNIYKCWEHIGDTSYIIGNIENKNHPINFNEAKWKIIGGFNFNNKCLNCKLLPVCLGGCPLNKENPTCPVYYNENVFWDILETTYEIKF